MRTHLVFTLAALFVSTRAFAQSPNDARAAADALFSAGQELMRQGRFPEACRKLEESYRIEPAGGTLLNLALCHEKEGRIASAWAEYRESAIVARRANRPDREKVALDSMAALEPQLPRLVLVVPRAARVPGLRIFRNGVELGEASWDVALPIDPGEVAIEARAPRYKTWTGKVTATIAQTTSLTIVPLEPEPEPPPAPVTPVSIVIAPPPERPTWWTSRRTIGVSLLAIGAASLGAGSYFGVRSLAKRSDSDAGCPALDGEMRCTSAGAAAMNDAKRLAWLADVGFALGAAAAITGGVLLVTAPSPVRVGAAPLPGGAAAMLSGSFE